MDLKEEFDWIRIEISNISLAIRDAKEKYKVMLDALDFLKKRVYTYPSKEAYMADLGAAKKKISHCKRDIT